jgi:LmbE family N-acetylglucosaminyl deacetylase
VEKILVIAAHPDDEVLGCAGTMARFVNEGKSVSIAILGEGVRSRHPDKHSFNKNSVDRLHAETRKAADLLGVKDLFFYNFPDNRFDTVDLLDIVKKLENLIDQVRPDSIYTHHRGDLNIDHVITHRAVLTATRPMADFSVKNIYAFEVPSSTDWAFGEFRAIFKPNFFVDIKRTLDVKLSAMKIYESEIRPFPHPRSLKALESIAIRWGSTVGTEAVEAFELIRGIH